jgi:hypothetical protein
MKEYGVSKFIKTARFAPFLAFLLIVPGASAQDSASPPNRDAGNAVGAVSDPATAALRDALSAACSQSEQAFAKFLTVRNAETFAHLTPSARVALMKRFVLLNEPGRAYPVMSSSGRPTLRCQTPSGAAELQIGGAELSDNLAFLPVEIREASTSANPMRIKMGLVRENGQWKLLSVGLVLLDLPALAFEWDAAEMESTERAAVEALKKIADAIETYRRTYARLPDSLAKLGPARPRTTASAESAGLLDTDLVAGARNGYRFRYVIVGAISVGAPAKYELAAIPETYGRTGRRSFLVDADGKIRGADHQGSIASDLDPKID